MAHRKSHNRVLSHGDKSSHSEKSFSEKSFGEKSHDKLDRSAGEKQHQANSFLDTPWPAAPQQRRRRSFSIEGTAKSDSWTAHKSDHPPEVTTSSASKGTRRHKRTGSYGNWEQKTEVQTGSDSWPDNVWAPWPGQDRQDTKGGPSSYSESLVGNRPWTEPWPNEAGAPSFWPSPVLGTKSLPSDSLRPSSFQEDNYFSGPDRQPPPPADAGKMTSWLSPDKQQYRRFQLGLLGSKTRAFTNSCEIVNLGGHSSVSASLQALGFKHTCHPWDWLQDTDSCTERLLSRMDASSSRWRVFVRSSSCQELDSSFRLYQALCHSFARARVHLLLLIDLQKSGGFVRLARTGESMLFYRVNESASADEMSHGEAYAEAIAGALRHWAGEPAQNSVITEVATLQQLATNCEVPGQPLKQSSGRRMNVGMAVRNASTSLG